jgi:hypothetical protein
MCSIRKFGFLIVAPLSMAALAGCQLNVNRPIKADLNQTPLVVDEAMQKRDWDRSVARYANGDTIGGPHLIVLQNTTPDPWMRVTDPVISVINDSLVPITTVLAPPWKDVIYQGVQTPPTYTAQPASRIIK